MTHDQMINLVKTYHGTDIFWEGIGPDGTSSWEEMDEMKAKLVKAFDKKDFSKVGEMLYNQLFAYVQKVADKT